MQLVLFFFLVLIGFLFQKIHCTLLIMMKNGDFRCTVTRSSLNCLAFPLHWLN
ncbi:hypothetical protein ACS0TY_004307 [Phlomoides rotata]